MCHWKTVVLCMFHIPAREVRGKVQDEDHSGLHATPGSLRNSRELEVMEGATQGLSRVKAGGGGAVCAHSGG